MLYIERIRQFRQENKLTQAEVSDALGITQQQYFKYEKGVNEMPVRYVVAFCRHYGVSADWLLGLREEQ